MNGMLKAHIRVNWLFYRRNRLLLLAALLFLAIMLLSLIPSFFFTSDNERFQLLMQIYNSVAGFLTVMIALIGLIAVWSHRNNKSIKLIFTKPCPPETWLAGHFVSAAILLSAGMLLALLLYAVGSLIWGIPFQAGILVLALNQWIIAMLMFCYLVLLTSWMHPLVAAIFFLVISDNMFRWLAILCRAGTDAMEEGVLKLIITGFDFIFSGLYYLLPSMGPLQHKMEGLDSSLRLPDYTGWLIAGELCYMVVFGIFCFMLTVLSLRRRRLN